MFNYNVRFIALGAFFIFLTLYGGEKLVWVVAKPDTQLFLQNAIEQVSTQNITKEQKEEIRSETLKRFSQPSIIGIAIFVLLAPIGIGFLLAGQARAIWNAPIAVACGMVITLAAAQAFSIGALLGVLIYASLSIPGVFWGRKVQK